MILKKIKTRANIGGFTIVELLVVIVIIAILASITMVSYNGITIKAVAATLKSDLKNASTVLEMDKTLNGAYPNTEAEANEGKGLPKSADTIYQYTLSGGDYYLSATSSKTDDVSFYISSNSGGTIADGVWSGHIAPGPGSATVAYGFKQITVGGQTTCALNLSDQIYCWGNSNNNQFGDKSPATSQTPVAIGTIGDKTVKSISAGGNQFVCAIASDDNAYCWGNNDSEQLGSNADTFDAPTAVDKTGVLSGKTIKSISAGYLHTCVIASDDNAYCWGIAFLGDGSESGESEMPVSVLTSGALSGKTIKSISAGDWHTCAIASDDKAYCWGQNGNGQLGDGSTANAFVPVPVDMTGALSGKTIKSISAGGGYTCAVASDDKAYCWGGNYNSQLGNNSSDNSLVPVLVDTSGVLNGKTIKSIAASVNQTTCAIASDDQAYCWGNGYNGQFGNSLETASSVPVAVDENGVLSGKIIKSIAIGGSAVCAIASDNQAYCWGSDSDGQLGNVDENSSSSIPIAVYSPILANIKIKSVTAGTKHTCVLTDNDQAYCWGENDNGQLGVNSDTTQFDIPTPVYVDGSSALNGKTIKSIIVGSGEDDLFTCAIDSDGKAYCWGDNGDGELGNSSTEDSVSYPTAVDMTGVLSGKTIKSIAAGRAHACVIASDDKVYCWGRNYEGQLGNNSTAESDIPVAVDMSGVLSGKTIKSIAAGDLFTCAIASDDKAYCWGDNSYGGGELGNNSLVDSPVPVPVDMTGALSGKTIKSISTGDGFACAIASDNQVYCWGGGYHGKLGNNSTDDSPVPVPIDTSGVLNGKTIKSLSSTGGSFGCVIASDNKVYCWGDNGDGQLGNDYGYNPSATSSSSVPVAVSVDGILRNKTITSISVGYWHTCAIDSEGKLYCWGYNSYGQLGSGSQYWNRSIPTLIN